ncbi:MAG TPA: hypothetical protein DD827_11965 [Gammaproteobacteria bacterium]|jgi:spermidine synthase|nr:hypothetical protein [Gammaproteobacteria bacterium]
MKYWNKLGSAPIPGTKKVLNLFQSKDDFHIKLPGGHELMSTRKHGSEDALGSLPCERLHNSETASVLIGGLGMGFTLAAVLASVGTNAKVTVAELIPEVVEWNKGPLGDYSGNPLDDPRTDIQVIDVSELLRSKTNAYDVIALDVDNGPEGLTQDSNNWLYTTQGINAARNALKPKGILAYWSAGADKAFHQKLKSCGFKVDEVMVYAHGNKGARHTIWLARER